MQNLQFKLEDKVNVKFISGTIPFGDSIYVNPAYWTLKSWYKRNGLNNDRIHWMPSIHYNVGLDETKIRELIESEKPHIICFGLYIWNQDLYNRLGQFIKTNWPDIILIGGGPDIYAHKDLELFWQQYNWLDFAIYGDGEEAFTLLLDNILGTSNELINVSYKPDVITPFKRFKDKEFTDVSPFLDNVDDVKYAIDSIRNIDPTLEIRVNWEFTKGCPYACSFCDWSSGLHHKVTRKTYNWKLDLDFLSSLDVTVRWADANIGMFKTDIDIIKYAYTLEDTNPKFQFIFRDFAKLHKQAVFDIIDFIETSRPGKIEHYLTVQDINPTVLDNIDRPDVPWSEFKDHIIKIKSKHANFVHSIEVMIGLPGQTLEMFAENLLELTEQRPKQVLGHLWCMLINSPGYDIEYRKKFNLQVIPAYNITQTPMGLTKDDLLANIDKCEYYVANFVLGTNTASMGDILAMYFMVLLYNDIQGNTFHRASLVNIISNIVYWRKFGAIVADEITKDPVMLLVLNVDNEPVTFNNYFKNKKTLIDFIKKGLC